MSNVAERFWNKVSKGGPHVPGLITPCWEWAGAYDGQGYPRFKLNGSAMYANRALLLIEGHVIGPEARVVTLCRNKRCVRPDHHVVGCEKDSRTVGTGGRIGPGDQYYARQMVAKREATVPQVAECYGVSLPVAEAMLMPVLPDVVDENVRLLICGYNVGPESARVGHYFANPQHRFWKTLHEVGLMPRTLRPEEDRELVRYGIGLTDLMKDSVHGDSAQPTDHDRARLRSLVSLYKPEVLVFLGKRPAKGYFGRDPGWGVTAYTLSGARLAVAPDPSPGNGHFSRLKQVWNDIAKSLK